MQRVGPYRIGAGFAHHALLQHQQCHRQQQGKDNHANAEPGRANRFRVSDPFDGLQGNQYRAAGNEQRLGHAGQRLGLAVSVTVIVVRRAQRVMHRQQVEQ
ncbi:hypothetical protein D3C81_2078080 [compost metagenome]